MNTIILLSNIIQLEVIVTAMGCFILGLMAALVLQWWAHKMYTRVLKKELDKLRKYLMLDDDTTTNTQSHE